MYLGAGDLSKKTAKKEVSKLGFGIGDYLRFAVPSLFGVMLFLVPIVVDQKITIGMGFMADALRTLLADYLPAITTVLLSISAVLSATLRHIPTSLVDHQHPLFSIFVVGRWWLLLRIVGAVFALLTYNEFGPEWIWSRDTGGVVLFDLAPVLITFFFFAALLLPLLVDFGFMEFIGTLLRNAFRKVFKLPGRSSIDAIASWMGSGTVGVLITAKQYETGFYSKREAAVIATNFSVASIAFSLLVTQFMEIDHLFIQFYATVLVTGVIAALITPRIPPLSRIKDEYYTAAGPQIKEDVPSDRSLFGWGLEQATIRAKKAPKVNQLLGNGLVNVADIWFGLLPLVMAIGTIAMALSVYTPVFTFLSYPLIPILEILRIPESAAAAPAILVGFADMFLPAVLAKDIESELTRFVVACVSMTQLIYMSEVGVLLIKSKIPLGFWDLFFIFIVRTLITLPLIAGVAHLIL